MAHDGLAGRARVIAELLLLNRLSPALRAIVPPLVAAVCAVAGVGSLAIQHHFADEAGGGRIASLIAGGSSAVTAWEGWAAALFFLVAVLRLRRGVTEPPAGRVPLEKLTAGQLRALLVREYTLVRFGLVILSIVTLVDATRALRYVLAAVMQDMLARRSLAAVLVEALGLVAATCVLALWAANFRVQLERLGALPDISEPSP